MTKKIQSRKNNFKTKPKRHNSRKTLMIGGANDTFVLVYNGINYQWEARGNSHESGIDQVLASRVIQAVALAKEKGQIGVKEITTTNIINIISLINEGRHKEYSYKIRKETIDNFLNNDPSPFYEFNSLQLVNNQNSLNSKDQLISNLIKYFLFFTSNENILGFHPNLSRLYDCLFLYEKYYEQFF